MRRFVVLLVTLAFGVGCSTAGRVSPLSWQDQNVGIEEVIYQEDANSDREWRYDDELPGWSESRHEFGVAIGTAIFPDLPDLEPTASFPGDEGFGNLQALGVSFLGSYYYRVKEDGPWWIGVNFGGASFEERKSFNVVLPEGERVNDDVNASLTFITLGGRYQFPVGPIWGFLGAGGGWYELSISEEESRSYYYSDEIVDDSAYGGFAELGFDVPLGDRWALRIEDQVHYFRFDGLNSFTPGRDHLKSLMHAVQIGVSLRF